MNSNKDEVLKAAMDENLQSMFSGDTESLSCEELEALRLKSIEEIRHDAVLSRAESIKQSSISDGNTTIDFSNPSDLKALSVLIENDDLSNLIRKVLSDYFLQAANNIALRKPQGRPRDVYEKTGGEMLAYVDVWMMKSTTNMTWQEIAEKFNSRHRGGKSDIKHKTLMREYRKYKNNNSELFESISKFLGY